MSLNQNQMSESGRRLLTVDRGCRSSETCYQQQPKKSYRCHEEQALHYMRIALAYRQRERRQYAYHLLHTFGSQIRVLDHTKKRYAEGNGAIIRPWYRYQRQPDSTLYSMGIILCNDLARSSMLVLYLGPSMSA